MQGLIMAAQMIAALTILVTIHEFGHYITARWFGVRVDKFFVFFDAWGKKLFSFTKGDTEYGVGWLPLGGYVKIAGMIDESMDKEFLEKEPEPWEFRSKKPWQKLIIMLAGIFLNVVLGVFIFTLLNVFNKNEITLDNIATDYTISDYGEEIGLQKGDIILGANGKEYNRLKDINYAVSFGGELDVKRGNEIVQLTVPEDHFKTAEPFIYLNSHVKIKQLNPDVPFAKEAGFKPGDLIIAVNGQPYNNFEEFSTTLKENKEQSVDFTVQRNGETLALNSKVNEQGQIGFIPDLALSDSYQRSAFGIGEAFQYGLSDAFNIVWVNIKAFAKIGKGEVKANETVGGPIKIATMFGAEWNWVRFWSLTAALSMVLAFMNILPIPALDGGHAVFAIIEWITGKPVNQKVLEVAQMIGFFLLMALMIFIFGNDIKNVFFS